ncbi:hypothetical protein [Leptothoe spongobia]|uniref:Lipoprotein n=1 Tax=Leptothoe spongobia TAU-MAC 1115 TaxID=1967444 RepID=A0A947DG73_9CYAN|nr:hypothetical protein [Leptothoe spongobia]MBT9316340.1 hypothetical protein [Leptothoe spongobia TAU-MAC 1115]
MPKRNFWVALNTPFKITAMLAIATIVGCNQPSVPTPTGETLLDSELTNLIAEDVRQQLDIANTQKHEKTVAICPENSAEMKIVIESAQDEKTNSLYLINVAMTLTKNDGFQIGAGEHGNPVNLGDESTVIMALSYLISCSKVSHFNQLSAQSLIEVHADGSVNVQ